MQTAHRLPGIITTDHEFSVPLDYTQQTGDQIRIFAREVVAVGKQDADLPWLLFLQGGPGFPSPRPEQSSGWIKRAVEDYRVLLLDQRGTGRSTPLTHQTLTRFLRHRHELIISNISGRTLSYTMPSISDAKCSERTLPGAY